MSPNDRKEDKVIDSLPDIPASSRSFDPQYQQSRQPMTSTVSEQTLVTYNHATYLLYVVSYFTAGLLWIVPIVMNYVKRHDADGTWLASHFDWQIKTFWYSIVFFALGMGLIIFSLGGLGVGLFAESGHIAASSFGLLVIGLVILGLTVLWHLYRIIRGWIALADKRPVP